MIRNLRKVVPLMKEAGELWMIKRRLLKKIRSKQKWILKWVKH